MRLKARDPLNPTDSELDAAYHATLRMIHAKLAREEAERRRAELEKWQNPPILTPRGWVTLAVMAMCGFLVWLYFRGL